MRKMCNFRAAAALAALLMLLSGCVQPDEATAPEHPFSVWYCSAEPIYGTQTGALCAEQIELPEQERTPERVIRAFLDGPKTDGLTFPSGQRPVLRGVETTDGNVRIAFSSDLMEMPGLARMSVAACLTMTLTQLPEVTSVELAVGSSPSVRYGPFTARDFVLYDVAAQNPEYTVTLYFPNYEGKLVGVRQAILCTDLTQLPVLTARALIAALPLEGSLRAIPAKTQVLDFSVTDGLASIVLSADFTACDNTARSAQNAVRSLVATLCALDGITSVKIAIVGDTDLSNYDISEPITASPDW